MHHQVNASQSNVNIKKSTCIWQFRNMCTKLSISDFNLAIEHRIMSSKLTINRSKLKTSLLNPIEEAFSTSAAISSRLNDQDVWNRVIHITATSKVTSIDRPTDCRLLVWWGRFWDIGKLWMKKIALILQDAARSPIFPDASPNKDVFY